MTAPARRTFGSDFKRFFLRGLAVLLPSVLTLWLLVYAYRFVDGFIAEPINSWIRTAMAQSTRYSEFMREQFGPTEEVLQAELARMAPRSGIVSDDVVRTALAKRNVDEWWRSHWWTNVIGLVVAVVGVYTAGRLLGGFLGRRVYARVEQVILSIPIIKAVYPSVKQVVDFLISEDRAMRFSRVVAVEYPRQGVWSVGLVTGETTTGLAPPESESMTIFIPSSPTPFTGYTVTVPRSQVHELPITIDQALRFVVSGGVLAPGAADGPPAAASADAEEAAGRPAAEGEVRPRPLPAPRALVERGGEEPHTLPSHGRPSQGPEAV